MYAEMFPARVRYSGVSIGYAFGAIIGGAFAPMIAQLILNQTGQGWMIGIYMAAISLVSLIAVSMVRKSDQGRDLHVEEVHQECLAEHPEFAQENPTAAQMILDDGAARGPASGRRRRQD